MYVPGSTEFTFSVHCGEIKQQVNIVSSPLQFWQFLDVKVIALKKQGLQLSMLLMDML